VVRDVGSLLLPQPAVHVNESLVKYKGRPTGVQYGIFPEFGLFRTYNCLAMIGAPSKLEFVGRPTWSKILQIRSYRNRRKNMAWIVDAIFYIETILPGLKRLYKGGRHRWSCEHISIYHHKVLQSLIVQKSKLGLHDLLLSFVFELIFEHSNNLNPLCCKVMLNNTASDGTCIIC